MIIAIFAFFEAGYHPTFLKNNEVFPNPLVSGECKRDEIVYLVFMMAKRFKYTPYLRIA